MVSGRPSITANRFDLTQRQVEVMEDRSVTIRLLFDKAHALDERILREQFTG